MLSATTKAAANLTKKSAVRDLKNAVGETAHDAQDAADGVLEDLSGYAHQAGEKLRGFMGAASEDIGEVAGQVTDKIRANPMRSGLIALGVGFIAGALMRR